MSEAEFEFFLPDELLPKDFRYPVAYVKCAAGPLPDIAPWHFFYSKLSYRYEGMRERYPSRVLIPFARRQDTDDVACFESDATGRVRVVIVHDFASPGWEERQTFDSFEEWLEFAKNEAKEWSQ